MPIMLVLYSLLIALGLAIAAPYWLWQMLRTGKYREGLGERLGRVPARLARAASADRAAPEVEEPGPAGRGQAGQGHARQGSVWVHAVSVGEVLAASRLIEELGRALPGVTIYLSTTTRTGQTLARERFGEERVFYFPLDFAFAMRAWLRFLRPRLVVLIESEFWPRMLVECGRAGVPVAVVNARVSDRSWPRYQRLRMLWRPLLGSLSLALAQSETDAERLRQLGATGARAAGNLKYDIRVTAPAPFAAELSSRLVPGVDVVVCGSTLAGEEALLLDALPLGELVTVLAPRHPERFEEVARLLGARGVPWVRRSAWKIGSAPEPQAVGAGMVVLLDSVGELASVYSLATLAVLGGGFLWPGGHNPLEPAQYGVPVLMGAGYANFREIVEAFEREGAIVITDSAGLKTTLDGLLVDSDRQRAIGEKGRRVFEASAGATSAAVAALLPLMNEAALAGDGGAADGGCKDSEARS